MTVGTTQFSCAATPTARNFCEERVFVGLGMRVIVLEWYL